ncbi:MAG: hypothetical protein OEX12_13565 [Gammaproteobacteria bacterium]|nr:hypothetical protein [Gammaproteobacteria bacterium]
MGLILGMTQGDDFYMDDTQAVVTKIHSTKAFDLSVVTSTGIQEYKITDQQKTTVVTRPQWNPAKGQFEDLPLVQIHCGARGKPDLARVVIEAPRTVDITRGDLWRKSNGEYLLSEEAKKDKALIFPEISDQEIFKMASQSAVLTHPLGNRRFGDVIFDMNGRIVNRINAYSEVAEDTQPDGDPMYDECLVCDGAGCLECDEGQVIVGYTNQIHQFD